MFFLFYGWLLLNLIAFALFGLDKRKAKGRRGRIPEVLLFIIALAGGSMGGLMAMSLFRHKTQKPLFRIGVPLVAILQFAAFLFCVYHWLLNIR